jgi:hypothetical protein
VKTNQSNAKGTLQELPIKKPPVDFSRKKSTGEEPKGEA